MPLNYAALLTITENKVMPATTDERWPDRSTTIVC